MLKVNQVLKNKRVYKSIEKSTQLIFTFWFQHALLNLTEDNCNEQWL